MPVIANDYRRCEMLNLGSAPGGRGPFAIRQLGFPPGSMTLKEESFLLRKDGVWVLNLCVFALPEPQQQQFLYPTSAEVMQALDGLQRDAVVEDKLPEGVSKEELLAAAENVASKLLSGLRNAKASPVS